MADIIINIEAVQQFHDDFDKVTRGMLDSLNAIRSSFATNCELWQDTTRQQFEELLAGMTANLATFIDNECQANLARLQELVRRAESILETGRRLHTGG